MKSNKINSELLSIENDKPRIRKALLDLIYKELKNNNIDTIDIFLGPDDVNDLTVQENIKYTKVVLQEFKEKKRIIKSFNLYTIPKYYTECISARIRLDIDKFFDFYKKNLNTKFKITDKIDISKFKKFLNKNDPTAQESKLVYLFFSNPNKVVSGQDIVNYASNLENMSVNGGKLIYKLKKILKNKNSIVKQSGGWVLRR